MTIDGRSIDDQALRIYLRDHHAAAVAGTALAQQISSHHAGTTLEGETAGVAAEVAADMRTLEAVMVALQIPTSRVKDVVAAAGERIAQLKPSGEVFEPRPLSRVVELETLSAGITAKAALWRSLQTVSAADPRLAEFDFAALSGRAHEQRDRVDACHRSAVPAALTEQA